MILLGIVKYFWRDAVKRISTPVQKEILRARVASLDVEALGLSPLDPQTYVQYAGSLTGRYFRAIAQVAPFLLYGLVPEPCYASWLALCALVPRVWQRVIPDKKTYLVRIALLRFKVFGDQFLR